MQTLILTSLLLPPMLEGSSLGWWGKGVSRNDGVNMGCQTGGANLYTD